MPMSASNLVITPESFFWSLEAISRELRLPFSRAILGQQFPPPYDVASVQLAARAMGVRAELNKSDVADLPANGASCFALVREPVPASSGSDSSGVQVRAAANDPGVHRFLRVHRVDKDTVVVTHAADAGQTELPLDGFVAMYTGISLQAEARQVVNEAGTDVQPPRPAFGLHWFAREMLRYPAIWRDVLIASVFIQLLALLLPLLTQVIIDKVITHRSVNTLLVVAAALMLITLFSAGLAWIRQYYILHTGTRIDAVLGADVFTHLLRLPARYFEHRSTGVLVARIHGAETIREFLAGAALTLVLDLPFMFLFAAVMLYYSPTLTWIALGVLAVLIVLSLAITPVLRRRINRQFLAGARHQAFVTEYLAGIETVKSLQLEPQLGRRFESLFADYLAAGFSARQLSNSFHALAQALEQLLSVAVLCAGAWLVISGADLTIGGLIAFQMFAARLTGPMLRITGLWQEFQQVDIAVRRLADIMDVPAEPVAMNPSRMVSGRGRLECRGLGFRYARRPWLFRNVSFTIEPGECVALIGTSGSGKSTLARLLQGFYLPAEGHLSIDGVDLGHMAANELRSYFGIVPQETRLFAGTVLQNLLDANPSASFADAVQACKLAQVHDVVEALPDGYLTRIGENGIGLSGGQKQRLAIARALVKQPSILIFDEATANLDAELSAALIDIVNSLRGQLSILFITHELPATLCRDTTVRLHDPAGDANERA